jgi:uncharacterized protein YndB with AHSA1/START domain
MPSYQLHTIHYKTYIHRPVGEVFAAISTADGWNGWFTTRCRLDLRPGGAFEPEWESFGPDLIDCKESGRVVAVEPPRRLVLQWTPVGPSVRTTIEFSLAEKFGGTVVEVSDSGYPVQSLQDQLVFVECACGWGEALTLLKFYLENGVRYRHPQLGRPAGI